jgi:peroxiredoxin
LRDHHDDVHALGGEIVAVGTGNDRYARTFVEEERIQYPVLVDDDGAAARAAAVNTPSFLAMFHPRTWAATVTTLRRGHRIHKAGARVTQMGATFVIGPGNRVHYEHVDRDSTDHAPLADVLRALGGAAA